MTTAVCPYCRAVIEDDGNAMLCGGCNTPHHADCYAENGGCTVFGCSAAPADEQKVTLTGGEVARATAATPARLRQEEVPGMLSGVGLMPPGWKPPAAPGTEKAAPPPLPPGVSSPASAPSTPAPYVSRFGSGSVLFGSQPAAPVAPAPVNAAVNFDLTPHPDAKNRTTFIVLGVLLGAFGAHNFYIGYNGKAAAQLCISLLTLGLGSPMSWVWAVIDVSTVDRDSRGIKLRS